MNTKHTWGWIMVAAMLFAFIFFLEQTREKPRTGPDLILPNLKAGAVTSVQVFPAGQFQFRAERAPQEREWFLSKPLTYPAQTAAIEGLLATLERLTPAAPPITARELRQHPKAETEYGLDNPQATVVIQQENYSWRIRFGARTAPGDQVFMRVDGAEEVFVVDAELLKLIPRTTNDWRGTTFANLQSLAFDRLLITNNANVIELQRDATNRLWRMKWPLQARADSLLLNGSLEKLQTLQIAQFVSDDSSADLETFGLQPAELELAFANGTNVVARLCFGKTNGTGQIFARRQGWPGVVAVAGDSLAMWRKPFEFFREPHLISPPQAIGPVEVRGEDRFALLPQTNGWRIAPQDFPVDPKLADGVIAGLATFEIEFYKNKVTEPELRASGLVSAPREITLKLPSAGDATNAVFAKLSFGITNDNKVLAARADEDSIYALKLADFQQLPWASWQLRDRRIWHFTENDVARIVTRQAGQKREILRTGTNSWALAPGSQGIINSFAIEEATHRFGELSATLWVERGAEDLGRYGITTNALELTFELKTGGKFTIAFGNSAPSQYPYAAVTLNQETWVFEFPLWYYQVVPVYLSPTSNTP